jgi:DCC1-like thiol-disulfide oxidoreductase
MLLDRAREKHHSSIAILQIKQATKSKMLPLQQNTISEQKTTESLWKIKLLFDGACPLCVREVNFLKRKDGDRGLIKFVDIVRAD